MIQTCSICPAPLSYEKDTSTAAELYHRLHILEDDNHRLRVQLTYTEGLLKEALHPTPKDFTPVKATTSERSVASGFMLSTPMQSCPLCGFPEAWAL